MTAHRLRGQAHDQGSEDRRDRRGERDCRNGDPGVADFNGDARTASRRRAGEQARLRRPLVRRCGAPAVRDARGRRQCAFPRRSDRPDARQGKPEDGRRRARGRQHAAAVRLLPGRDHGAVGERADRMDQRRSGGRNHLRHLPDRLLDRLPHPPAVPRTRLRLDRLHEPVHVHRGALAAAAASRR